jgi:hypothetical protein
MKIFPGRLTLSFMVYAAIFLVLSCAHAKPKSGRFKTTGLKPSKAHINDTEECSVQHNIADTCLLDLSVVRPTQFCVGYLDVSRKIKKIESARQDPTREPGEDFFAKPGWVVRGPSGSYYLIDGHHRARALVEAGEKFFRVKLIANLSSLNSEEFWQYMIKHRMVWLYDERGEGPQDPSFLPTTLRELTDDPYRTLAEDAQDLGANEKLEIPFQEFYWANFYRPRIQKRLLATDFQGALKKALKIARTPEAKDLPGYKGS